MNTLRAIHLQTPPPPGLATLANPHRRLSPLPRSLQKFHRPNLGPLRPNVFTAVRNFLRCGDLASGFLRFHCPDRDHYFGRIWKIQHKDAKKIVIPALEKGDIKGLTAALKSPNGHIRITAYRLLREAGQVVETPTATEPLAAYNKFKDVSTAAKREELIAAFAAADENWTKSALIAASAGYAAEVIVEGLVSTNANVIDDLVSNLLPLAMKDDSSTSAGKLVVAAAAAPATSDSLKAVILEQPEKFIRQLFQ